MFGISFKENYRGDQSEKVAFKTYIWWPTLSTGFVHLPGLFSPDLPDASYQSEHRAISQFPEVAGSGSLWWVWICGHVLITSLYLCLYTLMFVFITFIMLKRTHTFSNFQEELEVIQLSDQGTPRADIDYNLGVLVKQVIQFLRLKRKRNFKTLSRDIQTSLGSGRIHF